LDTPQDMSLGETAADIGMGFLPVVGTAQGARDFERARREDDLLGMGLSAASMIPIAGGVIKLGKKGASAARKAVDELSEIFYENPLNPREIVTNGAGATVYPMGDTLHLSDIRTFDPGKGNASQALRSILEVADKNNVPVTLTAKNYRGNGLTTSQLVDWYKRNGFEVVDDFGEDGVDMIRQPRGVAETVPGSARQMLDEVAPAVRQIDTPEFKNWFAYSKLLDDEGKPLRLYHATARDFDRFKPGGLDPTLSGRAMWFTDDKEYQPAMHNIGTLREGQFREGTNVMPVYLKMERPLVIDNLDMLKWAQKAFAGGSREFPYLMPQKWVDEVRRNDEYDGIILDLPSQERGREREYIVFEPTQIKSAIGNEGTFDPTNPVITKKEGGEVTTAELLAQMDRIGAGPPQDDSRGAYDLLVEAERRAAKKPETVRTESRGLLDRLNTSMVENVTEPVVGSLVDMTVGLGDLGQLATKYMAGRTRGPLAQRFLGADPRTGIPTEPVTPMAPRATWRLAISRLLCTFTWGRSWMGADLA